MVARYKIFDEETDHSKSMLFFTFSMMSFGMTLLYHLATFVSASSRLLVLQLTTAGLDVHAPLLPEPRRRRRRH